MKGRLMGMLAAATVGLASQAHALSISVGNIQPPGGNEASAFLRHGTLGIFGASSGLVNYMDLAAVDAIAGVVGGSNALSVFAVDTNLGTAMILASGVSFTVNQMNTNSPGALVFQTGSSGGIFGLASAGGGFLASGTPASSAVTGGGNLFAAAMVGLGANTVGGVTLAKGSTTEVRFLTWTGTAWTVDRTSDYSGSGTLNFNFEVLPLPAPLAIAGLGLVGAGVLRRRMSKV